MRVGVFTPLLSQLPLPAVLKKLAALQINTVELGTGNYPGDAHCKLSMLDDASALVNSRSSWPTTASRSARSVVTAIRCIPTRRPRSMTAK